MITKMDLLIKQVMKNNTKYNNYKYYLINKNTL